MENVNFFYGQKIRTGIEGLDYLLYGGIYLKCPNIQQINTPLTIAIYGDKGTSRALFAMQLLCGITRSIGNITFTREINGVKTKIKMHAPFFYSDNKGVDNLTDMLMDMSISQTISYIIKNNAEGKNNWNGSQFCNAVFDTSNQLRNIPLNKNMLDKYIGEEMLVYNIQTNALHLAKPLNQHTPKVAIDKPVFIRKKEMLVNKYAESMRTACILSNDTDMASNFFNVNLYSEREDNCIKTLAEYLSLTESEFIPCTVVDKIKKDETCNITEVLTKKSLVSIFIFDEEPDKKTTFDMMIELRRYNNESMHYIFNQLSIKKSVMQDTAIGWHIYKKRDYGIEIYPSSHVLLQKRRHMTKGLLLSQRSIIFGTYQRHLDELPPESDYVASFLDFENKLKNNETEFKKLTSSLETYNRERQKACPIDTLQKILIPDKNNIENRGEATAIIGSPNTYKRFLTLSSTFNACCNDMHTLYILLDKDYDIMMRRTVCPAYICKTWNNRNIGITPDCEKCYNHIHFNNIRMGCISPDEFFYYLIKLIKISRNSSMPISRIVIDDLQKIEFCFPMFNNDPLFLTTLISICKDYKVDLFMLCDKSSSLVSALRAQADNVICTRRTGDRKLEIFIERYSGYCSPSRMWKCIITDTLGMFCCDKIGNTGRHFRLDEHYVENGDVWSMDDYWIK